MLNQSAPVIYNVTNLLYEASHSQGSRQVDCKCYMRSCYHIIPEKNDLCCFGCVTSSLLHGVVNW